MLKLGIDSQPDLQPSGLADVQERADRDQRLVDRADLFCPGLNDAAAPWVRC